MNPERPFVRFRGKLTRAVDAAQRLRGQGFSAAELQHLCITSDRKVPLHVEHDWKSNSVGFLDHCKYSAKDNWLYVRGGIFTDTDQARDARAKVMRGTLRGMSASFEHPVPVDPAKAEQREVRNYYNRIIEASLVSDPYVHGASVIECHSGSGTQYYNRAAFGLEFIDNDPAMDPQTQQPPAQPSAEATQQPAEPQKPRKRQCAALDEILDTGDADAFATYARTHSLPEDTIRVLAQHREMAQFVAQHKQREREQVSATVDKYRPLLTQSDWLQPEECGTACDQLTELLLGDRNTPLAKLVLRGLDEKIKFDEERKLAAEKEAEKERTVSQAMRGWGRGANHPTRAHTKIGDVTVSSHSKSLAGMEAEDAPAGRTYNGLINPTLMQKVLSVSKQQREQEAMPTQAPQAEMQIPMFRCPPPGAE